MPLIAEGFLETPTAFGVPLGALLLFFWAMRAINESKDSPSSPPKRTNTRSSTRSSFSSARFTGSTEMIPLTGEVGQSEVEFLSSGFKHSGKRIVMQFRVQLHESGTFFIAGGQLASGGLSQQHYGYTMIDGSSGETISGTLSCPRFSTGKWAIGAFRDIGDVVLE